MALGTVIGAVFFILVFFAALTSAISLLETLVSIVMDKFHLSRIRACITMFVIAMIMAVPSSRDLAYGVILSFLASVFWISLTS